MLSTLKRAAYKEGLILRVVNASDEETQAALRLGVSVDAPYRTNLNEEILEELTPQGYRAELPLKGSRHRDGIREAAPAGEMDRETENGLPR